MLQRPRLENIRRWRPGSAYLLGRENLIFNFTSATMREIWQALGVRKTPSERRKGARRQMGIQAMMDVYKKVGTTGARTSCASLAGSWTAKVKSWCWRPSESPWKSTGNSDQKMILGGRFLQHEFSGEMMGKPVHRHRLRRVRQPHPRKYVSTWMDSMGTAILFFEGLPARTVRR